MLVVALEGSESGVQICKPMRRTHMGGRHCGETWRLWGEEDTGKQRECGVRKGEPKIVVARETGRENMRCGRTPDNKKPDVQTG
jgi:hypothetical protein